MSGPDNDHANSRGLTSRRDNALTEVGGPGTDIGRIQLAPIDESGLSDPKVFVEVSASGMIRVFDGLDPGAQGVVGGSGVTRAELTNAAGGAALGMEGLSAGSVIVSVVLEDGGVEICRDDVRVTAVDLELEWQTTNGVLIDEPNDHPSGTLGFKVFPGATAAGGGWNDLVQVEVATNPPVAGAGLFFGAYDPDDPSANNNVVDNDLTGDDNRDANHHDGQELSATEAMTDADCWPRQNCCREICCAESGDPCAETVCSNGTCDSQPVECPECKHCGEGALQLRLEEVLAVDWIVRHRG